MKNNFTSKGMVQKIIVILVFLILFNFVYPYVPSFADDEEEEEQKVEEAAGGILLGPVLDFVVAIGEGIVSVTQENILKLGQSTVHVTSEEQSVIGWIIGGALTGVAAVVTVALTGGAAIPVWAYGAGAVGRRSSYGNFSKCRK